MTELHFDHPPVGTCPLRATGPFRLVACQSIFLARWNRLPYSPSRVNLLDLRLWDGAGRRLGFYLEGLGRWSHGLQVSFGFTNPVGHEIRVVVAQVYLVRGGSSQLMEPNSETTFQLVGGS